MSTPRAAAVARRILDGQAGVYYVAANDTQRAVATSQAAKILEPLLREIEDAAVRKFCEQRSLPPPG